jgi:transcriptional regulator with PAS, ATPase and Fis domain
VVQPKLALSFPSAGISPQGILEMGFPTTLAEAVDILEKHFIEQALKRHEGNVTRAAKELGLTRQGLILKKKRLGLKS